MNAAAAAAAAEEEEAAIRIFVGGLGESVSSEDLRNIFSSNKSLGLGIQSVEIIRSKGRSFAYIDFFSSTNSSSLSSSTLLEKAKEHYLTRLTREWTEDQDEDQHPLLPTPNLDHAQEDTINKKLLISSKPSNKELPSENKQLRLFFPGLGKMKSIPFRGTGKHRYSFRRVEVPPLPKHFCDCDEHSEPPPAAAAKCGHIPIMEEQGAGMDEEELALMNSVMNKLFQMENVSDNTCRDIKLDKKVDDSIKTIDNPPLEENEGDIDEDDDNLIINMVSVAQENILTRQKPRFHVRRTSTDEPTRNVLQKQKRNSAPFIKKRKVVLNEESNTSEGMPAMPGGNGSLLEQQSKSGNASETLPSHSSCKEEQPKCDNVTDSRDSENNKSFEQENQNEHFSRIKEVGEHKEALSAKLDSASNKPGRGYAWLNKSSWTQLVKSSKPDGLEVLGSMKSMHDDISKKSSIDPTVDGTLAFGFRKEGNVQNRVAMSPQIVGGNAEASAPVVKKTTSETKPAYTRDVSIGESCSFMRTADSVKEWARTKAALSGSRKRKNNEK
ncbi:nucleolar protein [Salix suchowensis]|nr:nucleolar protein [Salix suchowensis]